MPIAETRGATAVSLAPAAVPVTPAARPAIEALPKSVPEPVSFPQSTPLAAPSHSEAQIEQQPEIALPSPTLESSAHPTPAEAVAATCAPTLPSDAATEAQRAVVEALTAARQSSAADAMADAFWILDNNEARVQTELSKTMLPVVMNQDAEKIARAALRDAGILSLTLLTGAAAPGSAKKSRPARSGSVQAKALEHPLVLHAQKLFNAEIQTVIDLRESE